MLATYGRVLRRPGTFAFSSAGLVARLPISMVGLGIVLLVEDRTGSYGLAGTVSATFVLAEAAFAVLHGRWVDHFGQSRVLPLALVCLTLGALFGAAEVTTVAFAEEQGRRWVAGWLLAAWSFGSLVAGLVTGAIAWRSGPGSRLRWGSAAMALAMAPLPFIGSVPLMAVVLLVGGLSIAPTLIGTMTMVEQHVPSARLTEGMAILHTGIVAGVAPGASIAGLVVDHSGASAAYVVALAGGVLGALVAQTARPPRP